MQPLFLLLALFSSLTFSLPVSARPSSRPASLPASARPSSRPASLPASARPLSRPASLPASAPSAVPLIRVRPSRPSTPESLSPSTFVTTLALEDAKLRLRDLADVLGETAGLRVRSSGGFGSGAQIAIRGSTSSQVGIWLDGLLLNHGGAGSVDLSLLSLDSLERVEIWRGFVPPELGGAIGGAIHLRTPVSSEPFFLSVTAGVGSFGSGRASVEYRQIFGRWQVFLSGGIAGSHGDFTYYDDRGTPLNAADDRPDRRRQNNAFLQASGLIRLLWRPTPKITAEVSNVGNWRQQGLSGLGVLQTTEAFSRSFRNLLQLRIQAKDWPTSAFRHEEQFSLWTDAGEIHDLRGEIQAERRLLADRSLAFAWTGQSLWLLPFDILLKAVFLLRYEEAAVQKLLSENLESTGALAFRRWLIAPGFQIQGETWQSRIAWQAVFRLETLAFPDKTATGTSHPPAPSDDRLWLPTGFVGLRFRPFRAFWLQTNAGRYSRPPVFLELFGDRGMTLANPKLRPEQGWLWDIGGVVERSKPWGFVTAARLEYSFFWTDATDLIRFVQNSQGTAIAVNLEAARLWGHEIRGSATLFGRLRFQAEVTLLHTLNLSSAAIERGKELPGRPPYEAFLQAEILASWGRGFYSLHLLGHNWLDRSNLTEIAERQLHHLGLSLEPAKLASLFGLPTPWDGLTLSFEIRNLLDTRLAFVPLRPRLPDQTTFPQAISDIAGYPLPGRSFWFSARWRFR